MSDPTERDAPADGDVRDEPDASEACRQVPAGPDARDTTASAGVPPAPPTHDAPTAPRASTTPTAPTTTEAEDAPSEPTPRDITPIPGAHEVPTSRAAHDARSVTEARDASAGPDARDTTASAGVPPAPPTHDAPTAPRASTTPTAPAAPSEAGYLTDLAEMLWPCGGRLERGNRATAVASRWVPPRRATEVREYLPVPSADRPRLILPRHNRYAATRGIAAFAQRHTPAAWLRTGALTVAFAAGLAPLLLRDRLRVAAGSAIEHALSSALDRELVIAVHVGPPRANRKPVLLLLTPGGRILGYAKIGVNDLTARLVEAETAALRRLGDAHLPDVTVPRLLHAGDWRGRPLLVQEALPVGGQTRRPTRYQLLRSVGQIAALDRLTERPLHSSPYRADLLRRLTALGPRPEAAALRDALARLPDTPLVFGAWHGDLTRWNIASTPRRAFVWDWERLAFGVPVGFDALHFELNEAVRDGVHAGVWRWLDRGARLLHDPLLARVGLRPDTAPTVMALYLVDVGARYLHDRQAEAGGPLSAVDEWLLPTLRTLTDGIPPP